MRSFILLILTTALLSACGGGNGGGGNGASPLPVKQDHPEPPEPPPRPQKPDNRLGLRAHEIKSIGQELRIIVQQGDWNNRMANEKKTLIGAWLYQATEWVKPLKWEQMTDEDLDDLVSLYFDENLILKFEMKKEIL